MKKLNIIIDLDSIVADFMPAWIENYNKIYNDDLVIADISTHDLRKVIKPEATLDKLFTKDLFLNLKPLPGAVEAVKELNDKHLVHIVTASAAHYPETASAKLTWCTQYLSFIDPYMVTLSAQKHLIHGDVIIDDRWETIKKCSTDMYRVTIAYPWNVVGKRYYDLYVEDYTDTASCWKVIVENIHNYASTF